jgi:hypothetical protein
MGKLLVRLALGDVAHDRNPHPRTFHVGDTNRDLHREATSVTSLGNELVWGECARGGIAVLQQRQQPPYWRSSDRFDQVAKHVLGSTVPRQHFALTIENDNSIEDVIHQTAHERIFAPKAQTLSEYRRDLTVELPGKSGKHDVQEDR